MKRIIDNVKDLHYIILLIISIYTYYKLSDWLPKKVISTILYDIAKLFIGISIFVLVALIIKKIICMIKISKYKYNKNSNYRNSYHLIRIAFDLKVDFCHSNQYVSYEDKHLFNAVHDKIIIILKDFSKEHARVLTEDNMLDFLSIHAPMVCSGEYSLLCKYNEIVEGIRNRISEKN